MSARLHRRALQEARPRRWFVLSVLLGLVALAIIVPAGNARALDIPGVEICKPSAPYPASPEQGLTGALTERPAHPAAEFSPEHIYTSGGLAGMGSHTYDLGCDVEKKARAGLNNTITNGISGASGALVALTDSVERRAWNPQWITAFLGSFADQVSTTINTRIWVPLIGLGLLATSVILIWRGRTGDVSGQFGAIGWVLLVLLVAAGLMLAPTGLSRGTQALGDAGVSALNGSGSSQAAEASTDSVVQSVQYQAWLRRTFGDANSEAATTYGPALLEASRISWIELDAIRAGRISEEDLIEAKRQDFSDVAAKVEKEYPSAYRYLQGDPDVISPVGPTVMEALYTVAISFFRLVADLLMVTCLIFLTILGLVFLLIGGWVLTPAGAHLGRSMADSAVTAIGYGLMSALAVWLFTVYAQAAMAPGMSMWWSMVMLFLGTIIFWTMLRPDRKMLAMLSAGQIDGSGRIAKMMFAWWLTHAAGKSAGKAAAQAATTASSEPAPETTVDAWVTSRPVAGALPAAPVFAPAAIGAAPAGPRALSDGTPEVIQGQVLYSTDSAGTATKTFQVSEPPAVPPPGSIAADDIYQRGDDREDAR